MCCITAVFTSGCGNLIYIYMLKSCYGFCVRMSTVVILTSIYLSTCNSTRGSNIFSKAEVMTDSRNLYAIRIVTVFTLVNFTSVNSTSCTCNNRSAIYVTGSNRCYCNLYITATTAYFFNISVSCTISYNNGRITVIMSPSRTSFSRCESCYSIGGEVVGFECNEAVSIGCFNRLNTTVIGNEPDNNTVNVFTVRKFIRNGNLNLTGELGNRFTCLCNGKVIYRVVANLLYLLGCKSYSGNIVSIVLISRNVNVLACKSTIGCFTTEVDVSVFKSNLAGACKIIFRYICICLVRSIYNLLGFVTILTSVGGYITIFNTGIPLMAVIVFRNSSGSCLSTANFTFSDSSTFCGTGGLRSNGCYRGVSVLSFNSSLITAKLTIPCLSNLASVLSFNRIYTCCIMRKKRAYILTILVSAF